MAVAVLAYGIGMRLRRLQLRLASGLSLAAMVGFLLYAGEEISWGQRVFGFESMGAFATANEQGEFTLHNFITVPLDTANYGLSVLLLVAVPLLWHHAGLREAWDGRRGRQLEIFMPEPWVALVAAPSAGFLYVFWKILPVQAMVTLGAAVVIRFWLLRCDRRDRSLAVAVVATVVVGAALMLMLGEYPETLRNHTEYRETMIILGVLAYAVGLRDRVRRMEPAE